MSITPGRRLLAFLTKPLVIPIGCMFMLPAASTLQQLKTAHFQRVTGTVLSGEVIEHSGSDSSSYEPHLKYRFQVGVDKLEGDAIRLGGSFSFSRADQAQAYLDEHPAKSAIVVWYNPEDPQQNLVGKPGLSSRDLLFIAIASLGLSGALSAIFIWWRDRRYAGGFPITPQVDGKEINLNYTAPILAVLGYLPPGFAAAGVVARIATVAGVMPMIGTEQLMWLASAPMATALWALARTVQSNHSSSRPLVVEPGRVKFTTMEGSQGQISHGELRSVVLERELYDSENGHACYHLRLKSKDDSLSPRLLELQTHGRAQALASAIAELAKVAVETLDCGDEDSSQKLRSQVIQGLKEGSYEELPSSEIAPKVGQEVRGLTQQLEKLGFQSLATLGKLGCARGSTGVRLLGRGGQWAEINWTESSHPALHSPWINICSRLTRDQGPACAVTVSNATFTTPMPKKPPLARLVRPGAGVDLLVSEHDQLLAQAVTRGWVAEMAQTASFHMQEKELVQFYRDSIQTMPVSQLQPLLREIGSSPVLAVDNPIDDLRMLDNEPNTSQTLDPPRLAPQVPRRVGIVLLVFVLSGVFLAGVALRELGFCLGGQQIQAEVVERSQNSDSKGTHYCLNWRYKSSQEVQTGECHVSQEVYASTQVGQTLPLYRLKLGPWQELRGQPPSWYLVVFYGCFAAFWNHFMVKVLRSLAGRQRESG